MMGTRQIESGSYEAEPFLEMSDWAYRPGPLYDIRPSTPKRSDPSLFLYCSVISRRFAHLMDRKAGAMGTMRVDGGATNGGTTNGGHLAGKQQATEYLRRLEGPIGNSVYVSQSGCGRVTAPVTDHRDGRTQISGRRSLSVLGTRECVCNSWWRGRLNPSTHCHGRHISPAPTPTHASSFSTCQ